MITDWVTPHLKEKILSTNSPWDFEGGMDTIKTNWDSPENRFAYQSTGCGAIYCWNKTKKLVHDREQLSLNQSETNLGLIWDQSKTNLRPIRNQSEISLRLILNYSETNLKLIWKLDQTNLKPILN